jgi:hypothetical protein
MYMWFMRVVPGHAHLRTSALVLRSQFGACPCQATSDHDCSPNTSDHRQHPDMCRLITELQPCSKHTCTLLLSTGLCHATVTGSTVTVIQKAP